MSKVSMHTDSVHAIAHLANAQMRCADAMRREALRVLRVVRFNGRSALMRNCNAFMLCATRVQAQLPRLCVAIEDTLCVEIENRSKVNQLRHRFQIASAPTESILELIL